jgi:hypothetical protein
MKTIPIVRPRRRLRDYFFSMIISRLWMRPTEIFQGSFCELVNSAVGCILARQDGGLKSV